MNRIIETDSFRIHKIKVSISNSYLVESSSGMFIIDPGAFSDIQTIKEYMRNTLSCTPSDLKFSVISHMHPDHSGGSAALKELYHVPIAAFPGIQRWYAGISGFIQFMFDCYMTHGVAKKQKMKIDRVYFKRRIKPDLELLDDKELPLFPEWKSLHIPGHTNHDIGLYNSENKILFVADSIVGARDRCDLPMPIIFPNKMEASYKKLSTLTAETILLGHGKIIETDNSKIIFDEMNKKMGLPLSSLSKKVHWLSYYSPQIRRTFLRDFIKRTAYNFLHISK